VGIGIGVLDGACQLIDHLLEDRDVGWGVSKRHIAAYLDHAQGQSPRKNGRYDE
jgi:hypothetical protein